MYLHVYTKKIVTSLGVNLHLFLQCVVTVQHISNIKGPVTLRRIAPTYADVWKIQQVRWYTLSTLEIRF